MIFAFSPVVSNESFLQDIMGMEITSDQNEFLITSPSNEEIKAAVFSLSAESSPGPDGYNGHFFHRYWDVVQFDVQEAVRYFFSKERIPKGFNASFCHSYSEHAWKLNVLRTSVQFCLVISCIR